MLDTLRYRDFRLIWIATILSTSYRWMDQIVGGWLILQLTNSPLLLGVGMALRSVGWLLSPLGGIASDRMDRKRLLQLGQITSLVQSLAMLGLVLSGRVQVWEILALAFLSGLAATVDWPVRTVLMADLVDERLLTNAMAFNRMAQDITQIASPLMGGAFIALFGFPGAYGLIAAFNVASIVSTQFARSPAAHKAETGPVWEGLKHALAHIKGDRTAQGILWLAAVSNFVGFTLSQTLLPVFARDTFKTGPFGLGLMMSSLGAGALIASLTLAAKRDIKNMGALTMASFFVWPVAMVLVAVCPWFILSFPILLVTGVVQSLTMTTTTALLLVGIPKDMKGRVMGVRALVIGFLPLGNFLAGAGISLIGVRLTTGASAAIMGSIVAGVFLGYRELRKL